MLKRWGATCGQCHPAEPRARANHLIAAARRGQPATTAAWLVVLETLDSERAGSVVRLTTPITVITRAGAESGLPGEQAIRDDFLSAGHAVVTRGETGEHAIFTLSDRREPGPSANGTFLNGKRLHAGETAPLGDGDAIRVGTTHLVFRALIIPGGSP